ncbi:hypothetical protein HYPSUDRAFT_464923 [Hypholoma sublateritium FD-334 SS-4]|uniref:Uncharacterized protein n=1 Tax=Hypholoma sublateritium (strain FD-334 SS-4) TaxID=945553 RepID=A0A0D2P1I7_HYPSF|nr:hypothetical protein HYPSUDRAFT_464923 [Hypholoma sublateritium FD-334 SS-4]
MYDGELRLVSPHLPIFAIFSWLMNDSSWLWRATDTVLCARAPVSSACSESSHSCWQLIHTRVTDTHRQRRGAMRLQERDTHGGRGVAVVALDTVESVSRSYVGMYQEHEILPRSAPLTLHFLATFRRSPSCAQCLSSVSPGRQSSRPPQVSRSSCSIIRVHPAVQGISFCVHPC